MHSGLTNTATAYSHGWIPKSSEGGGSRPCPPILCAAVLGDTTWKCSRAQFCLDCDLDSLASIKLDKKKKIREEKKNRTLIFL